MRRSARLFRHPVLLAAAGAFALLGTSLGMIPNASAAATATISVKADTKLATIPATGVGTNVAVYDGNMNGSAIPGLLSAAGIKTVRYPGGSYGDIYHWQTNTTEGGYVAPDTDFDTYMGTVKAAGAQPIIIANYGSGTPQEAADWVRYANVTKGYGAKYWEIGNEVYGNGEYGSNWETDKHSSHSATTYATNLLQYASAMKAVDPTVKIGAVLTTPGSWPDGITGPGDTQDWNHTVLSIAGSKIDFVIVHHYPNATSAPDLLGRPHAEIPGMASTLHSLIKQYAGSNAANVGIAVTEANGNYDSDTSPSGLFAPDEYLTWMENGAFTLDWWDMHNGTDCSRITTVEGATDYNDGGILSSGASCEPPLNTPFAPYYGTQMITKLGSPGDALVQADSSASLVTAHAVKRSNGDVDVMLINKDPGNAATVSLSYSGFTPSSSAPTVYTYGKNATSITSAATGTAASQTVPAYAIVVVQMHPATGGTTAGGTTTGGSTTGATTGGTTTGGSAQGSTGGTSTGCTATYTTTNSWSGGYQGEVKVTAGSTAVNGWTVTWTLAGGQTITQVWNGTLTTSGTTATVKNASYNGTLYPSATTTFGFLANGSPSTPTLTCTSTSTSTST
ncbi:cellulose binding domain-containing protein [Streptomyces sp. NBC_01477]|uniref:cellulose binding domain-containing protein n=1 Tax=Streptomyces sp. NBC_01477 TaxID=2976015 RepID=UPI002E310BE7|nr:cellulose binding domain-containing protein [Streptomyces sp. NBC_01477]